MRGDTPPRALILCLLLAGCHDENVTPAQYRNAEFACAPFGGLKSFRTGVDRANCADGKFVYYGDSK